ncbi:MAG: energy transducer TonB [Gammaproteobacteria bacterium]|nr:MAG: energy transducer TonB [Gammaproteobacteria bacterium]
MKRIAWILVLLLTGCAAGPTRPPLFMAGDGPVYPSEAKAQGVEGYVEVRYAVTVDGVVDALEVVDAQPEGVFEEAALNAVRAWRYKPMVIKGEIQRAENVRSTLRFEIGEPERYEDL